MNPDLGHSEERLHAGGLHLTLLVTAVGTELPLWHLLLGCILRGLPLLQAILSLQSLQALAV